MHSHSTLVSEHLTRDKAIAWFDRSCDCGEVLITPGSSRALGWSVRSPRGRLRRVPDQEGFYYVGAEPEPLRLVPPKFRWAQAIGDEPSPLGFLGYRTMVISLPIGDGTDGTGVLVQRVH